MVNTKNLAQALLAVTRVITQKKRINHEAVKAFYQPKNLYVGG